MWIQFNNDFYEYMEIEGGNRNIIFQSEHYEILFSIEIDVKSRKLSKTNLKTKLRSYLYIRMSLIKKC